MDDDTRQRFREQDSYLQGLLALAEDGTKVPVTLSIGGLLVTGHLISTQEYGEGGERVLFEAVEASEEGREERDAGKEAFLLRRQIYEDIEEGDKYVHLQNARFYAPSGQPWMQPEGFLWHGKAAAVDGFVMGTFNASSS